MSGILIETSTPRMPGVQALIGRHLALMYEISPPESVHALTVEELEAPGITFFSARVDGALVGMGALKDLGPEGAEIKSMHIISEMRGRGIAGQMVAHIIAHARDAGHAALLLETGSEPAFAPARQLYERFGFGYVPPFADYQPDPHSVFMRLSLTV